MASGLNHALSGVQTNGHHDEAGPCPGERHSVRQTPKASPSANGASIVHRPPHLSIAGYFRWKGAVDRAAALMLLVPGIPLMLVLVLIVRLTSRGSAIYRQVRVGRGGKTFTMYKIRTMVADAEARSGAVWTRPGDPRVTRVGRVFRKLHLDELPQLFNVLKGEMSLMGPRPERPEFVETLARAIDGYLARISVRPGITGLAQINLPPDTDLDSVRRKLVLDLEYVETANLLLDVRMFFCTLVRLCGLPGASAMWLFGLQRAAAPSAIAPQPGGDVPCNIPDRLSGAHGNGSRPGHGNANGKPGSNGHHAGHRPESKLPTQPR